MCIFLHTQERAHSWPCSVYPACRCWPGYAHEVDVPNLWVQGLQVQRDFVCLYMMFVHTDKVICLYVKGPVKRLASYYRKHRIGPRVAATKTARTWEAYLLNRWGSRGFGERNNTGARWSCCQVRHVTPALWLYAWHMCSKCANDLKCVGGYQGKLTQRGEITKRLHFNFV